MAVIDEMSFELLECFGDEGRGLTCHLGKEGSD